MQTTFEAVDGSRFGGFFVKFTGELFGGRKIPCMRLWTPRCTWTCTVFLFVLIFTIHCYALHQSSINARLIWFDSPFHVLRHFYSGFDSESVMRLGFTTFAKLVSVSQMDCADSLKRIWNRFRFRQMDHALTVIRGRRSLSSEICAHSDPPPFEKHWLQYILLYVFHCIERQTALVCMLILRFAFVKLN